MNSEVLFTEKQRFTQNGFKFVLFLINIFFVFAFIKQVLMHEPFGNHPMSDKGIIFALAFIFIIDLLFLSMKLVTTITMDAVIVRLYPFHIFPKRFEWSQLNDVIIREYDPLKEFSGWGLRGFGKKKSMTVSGSWLIELVFLNDQKLLIGTRCPSQVKEALMRSGFSKSQKS